MYQLSFPNFSVTINLIEYGKCSNVTGINNGTYWGGFGLIVISD